MKIVKKDGKHYLVGTSVEVGRALIKRSRAAQPIDIGWSLNKQADEASTINDERYACSDCNYGGLEATFVGGGCPECGSKNLAKA